MPDSENFVRTFARGLSVIDVMGQSAGKQTIAQISDGTGLPRTVVRRLLLTLVELGFVKSDERNYWLTAKTLRLGMTYLYTLPFWRQSQVILEDLGTNIKQSCAIAVLDEADIVYIQRFHAKRILATNPSIGSRLPAHAVSMGRVLLSGLPKEQIEEYLTKAEIKRLTPHTKTDKRQLLKSINEARDEGYAWVDSELDEAICGLAVPVRNRDGEIIAAVNVSLLSGEYSAKEAQAKFLPMLKLAASQLRAQG